MTIAGSAAVVASAVALADLAGATGWGDHIMWLLPAAVDVGGAVGGWAWLRPGATDDTRQCGCIVALSCITASLAGNALSHLIAANVITVDWPLIVVVGAIPAAIVAALTHLASLLTIRPTPTPAATEQRVSAPSPVTSPVVDDDPPLPTTGGVPKARLVTAAKSQAKKTTTARIPKAATKPAIQDHANAGATADGVQMPDPLLTKEERIAWMARHLPGREDWSGPQWQAATGWSEGTTRRTLADARDSTAQTEPLTNTAPPLDATTTDKEPPS